MKLQHSKSSASTRYVMVITLPKMRDSGQSSASCLLFELRMGRVYVGTISLDLVDVNPNEQEASPQTPERIETFLQIEDYTY